MVNVFSKLMKAVDFKLNIFEDFSKPILNFEDNFGFLKTVFDFPAVWV